MAASKRSQGFRRRRTGTGAYYRVNRRLSMLAKRSHRKFKGRHLSATRRRHIALAERKVRIYTVNVFPMLYGEDVNRTRIVGLFLAVCDGIGRTLRTIVAMQPLFVAVIIVGGGRKLIKA
jgi:hypothetical protein